MSATLLEKLLPLRPADLVLLAELQDGPRHGYALAQAMARRTDGRIRVRPGDLYRVLFRMSEQGLVAAEAAAEVDPRRKTTYRLTALGDRALREEARRLAKLSAEILARPVEDSP